MRRLVAVASLLLVILVTAGPALASADTFNFRGYGNSASATFTNVPFDQEELPPGTYFYTDLWASHSIVTGDGDVYEDSSVCLYHAQATLAADGSWTEDRFLFACAGGVDLSFGRRLSGASLVANLPVEECLAWDEETGECTEIVNLGTIMVELTWVGDGPISRYHGTGSGGSAGNYQYSYHGTGSGRNAIPSGSVTLVRPDGTESDLTGGVDGNGYLSQSRDGWIDVSISNG